MESSYNGKIINIQKSTEVNREKESEVTYHKKWVKRMKILGD